MGFEWTGRRANFRPAAALGRAALVLACSASACAFGQQQLQLEVRNAASGRAGDIAPGALAELDLFAPGGGSIPSIDFPMASAQILPFGFDQPLPLQLQRRADRPAALVLIPRDIPLGAATVTLTYDGLNSVTGTVNIAATSFGLYAVSGFIALAQNVTSDGLQLNNLTHPAHPLDYITLWGTGLGRATSDQVNVLLGGLAFPVSYAGASAEIAGLDQINFQLPDDAAIPQGCYVALNVKIGDSTSNLAALSLSRDPGPCHHPFGLTADQLAQLDSGGQVNVGLIDFYSTIGPPAAPSLDPANGYVRTDFANADFLSYDAGALSEISGPLFADDAFSGCTLSGFAPGIYLAVQHPLGVGDFVDIQGPHGKELRLLPQSWVAGPFYSGSAPQSPVTSSPDQLAPPFFSAGQWQVSAPGSDTVQAFTAGLSIPDPIQITNYDQARVVDAARDLTIKWNPATYSSADFLTAAVYGTYGTLSSPWANPSPSVLCRFPASAGTAVIPAGKLASIAPSNGSSSVGSLSLSIGRKPGTAATFKIALADGSFIPAAIQYHSAEWVFVQFARPH